MKNKSVVVFDQNGIQTSSAIFGSRLTVIICDFPVHKMTSPLVAAALGRPHNRYATMRTIDPRHLVEKREGMPLAPLWHVILRALQDWWNDNCLRLAASLAYYTQNRHPKP